MKTSITATSCFIFFLLAISSCKKSKSSSNVNLNNGLIAYYPFNDNANDAGPNKLNGTIYGGVTFSPDVSGKSNSAVTFDGSTGYILVPDALGKFQTSTVSVSFLTNLSNSSNRQAFVSSMNFSDASGLSYGLVVGQNNLNKLQFVVEPNTLGCNLAPYDPSTVITASNTISNNTWYHIVAIFSDSSQKIFINGVLNTAVTRNFSTMNQCSNNKDLIIGGWWSGDIISVSGSMDEVRIYNRTLNQDEINELAKPVH